MPTNAEIEAQINAAHDLIPRQPDLALSLLEQALAIAAARGLRELQADAENRHRKYHLSATDRSATVCHIFAMQLGWSPAPTLRLPHGCTSATRCAIFGSSMRR